jgi:hypothetical protein
MNNPTTNQAFYELVNNEQKLLQFLVDNKIVPRSSRCTSGKCKMPNDNKLVMFDRRLHYKCNWSGCRNRWAVNSNIFNLFSESKMSVAQILEIIWYWSWNNTATVTSFHTKHAYRTILSWFKKIRNVCYLKQLSAPAMGGPGWQIQIDESLFHGRRKYNRGRLRKGDKKPKEPTEVVAGEVEGVVNKRNYGNRVDGPWVFGLVAQKISDIKNDEEIKLRNREARRVVIRQIHSKAQRRVLHKDHRKINTAEFRTYENRRYKSKVLDTVNKHVKEVRMFVVDKRDTETLMPMILRNVKQGSQINSDEWRAYSRIKTHGYKHCTVNHSKNFIDPDTREHTQLIECLWLVAKSTIMKRRRGTCNPNLPGHLAEEWFRSLDKKCSNIFINILECLKEFSNSEVEAKTATIIDKHNQEKIDYKNKYLVKKRVYQRKTTKRISRK